MLGTQKMTGYTIVLLSNSPKLVGIKRRKMKTIILLIVVLLLAGCAPNYVRIIKMDANWLTGRTDGCQVETKGSMKNISVTYEAGSCSVIIEDKK